MFIFLRLQLDKWCFYQQSPTAKAAVGSHLRGIVEEKAEGGLSPKHDRKARTNELLKKKNKYKGWTWTLCPSNCRMRYHTSLHKH